MNEAWLRQLEAWRDFYVLVGTVAATLMGLFFVIVSLGPQVVATETERRTTRALISPNVGFFTTAVIVSALMLIPAITPSVLGAILAIGSISALVYLISVQAFRQWRLNHLPWTDLVWFVSLPFPGYLMLLISAAGIWTQAAFGLYSLAASVILLLVIGIHNAWDVVLWVAQQSRK